MDRGYDDGYGYDGYYGGRSSSRSGMDRRDDIPPPRGLPPGLRDRGFRGTPENAKTKMCMRWMSGDCRFGDRCNFAHGESELRRSRREEGSYYEGDRGGYQGRDGGYYEGRGSYRDYRDAPSRGYDISPRRGERDRYASNGGPYPPRSSSRQEPPPPRGDRDRDRDRERDYYPPSRGSGGGEPRGGSNYRDHHSPPPRPNQSEKPSGMSDEVWAGSGYPVPGSNGWWRYTTEKGEQYYHNYREGTTQWDKPEGWVVVPASR